MGSTGLLMAVLLVRLGFDRQCRMMKLEVPCLINGTLWGIDIVNHKMCVILFSTTSLRRDIELFVSSLSGAVTTALLL